MAQRIRIRIESFDHEIIDSSAVEIVNTASTPLHVMLTDPITGIQIRRGKAFFHSELDA